MRDSIPFELERFEQYGDRRHWQRFWTGYGYQIHEIHGVRTSGRPGARFHVSYLRAVPSVIFGTLRAMLEGPGVGGSWPTMAQAERAANRHRAARLDAKRAKGAA